MTAALLGYSSVFMRYSMMVTPKNYLIFGMHFVNFGAQSTQAYRFVDYWYRGGRELVAEQKAKEGLGSAQDAMKSAEGAVKDAAETAKDKAVEVKGQVEKGLR